MDIFEFIFNENDEENSGVFAMSMVNKPAMKQSYVLLSENKVLLKVQDAKKKILTGVALMPDVLIPRIDPKTGDMYQAFFSSETIEKTAYKFLKDFNQKNVTVEHMLSVDDCAIVESWIKTDGKLDKSVSLGIDAPVGSWLMTLKVEDNELWDGLIETGLLTGFSIEGNYDRKPTTTEYFSESKKNKQIRENKEMNVIKAIRELFLGKDTLVEAEAVAEVSRWWLDLVDGSSFELNSLLMRKGYDDSEEPFPISAGEYELEDGKRILVDSDGIIRYIFDNETPVAPVEETAEETVEASEVSDAPVVADAPAVEETPAEPVAETVEETPAEPVAETTTEEPATVADVVEQINPEVEPQMIPLTDAERKARNKKVKFNSKLTVQERIKLGLGTLEI